MKNVIKLSGLIVLATLFALGMTSCDDGNNEPTSISYSAVDDDGNIYIVEIIQDPSRSAYYPQVGDTAHTYIEFKTGDRLSDTGKITYVDPSGSPIQYETSEGDLITIEVNEYTHYWENKYGGLASIDGTFYNGDIKHDIHIIFNYVLDPDDDPGGVYDQKRVGKLTLINIPGYRFYPWPPGGPESIRGWGYIAISTDYNPIGSFSIASEGGTVKMPDSNSITVDVYFSPGYKIIGDEIVYNDPELMDGTYKIWIIWTTYNIASNGFFDAQSHRTIFYDYVTFSGKQGLADCAPWDDIFPDE